MEAKKTYTSQTKLLHVYKRFEKTKWSKNNLYDNIKKTSWTFLRHIIILTNALLNHQTIKLFIFYIKNNLWNYVLNSVFDLYQNII